MASLKLALRTLTKTPFITAVAILSLALGVGANSAIFSLFDRILLQALPVQEPDRLVNLAAPGPKPGTTSCNQAGDCNAVFSYPMFRDLQQAQTGFSGVAAHRAFGANLARAGQTVSGRGLLVSGSYFPLLGVQPALGRLLGPADDKNIGEHFVAVLSYGYWENRLGSDSSVLNDTIVVNGHPMTIVGVAARGFEGTTLGSQPDVFVPITMRTVMSPWFDGFDNRLNYWAYVFARLKPRVTLGHAGSEINTLYHAIINDIEAPLQEGMSEATMGRFRAREITVERGQRGQSSLHREVQTPLLLLLVITAIVLLIACGNVANLLLARGATRHQEMAIRGSLGASRRHLLAQLLTESCLLSLLGGLASLLVARWTLGLIASVMPAEVAGLVSVHLDARMLLFAAAVSLGTGVIFGLYPALHATRQDLVTTLKANSGQPSGARAAARFRTSLVVVQLALSTALLVGAGLFIKSLVNVSRIDLGLQTADIVTFGISPQLNGYEPERSLALFESAEEQLAAIPGVAGVSAAAVPILQGNSWGNSVSVEGFESGPDVDANSRFNEIGPAYFRTLGIPLLAGREFSPADAADAPRVAIINEAFAVKFGLDARRAVGKRMAIGGGVEELDIEIVGVVQNAKYAQVKNIVPPLFFTPYRQDTGLGWINFYVRATGQPEQVLRAIPTVIERLDPNLPVEDLKTLQSQVRESVFLDRIISTLSASFAALATLLAAVGLYGVLSYTVAQRTREIGVRMALGADGRRVRAMVLHQVGRMILIGGALGLGAALLLGRAASSLLFGLEGHDPLVIAAATLVLAGVAFGAAYVPALRASRIDPMQALRYE